MEVRRSQGAPVLAPAWPRAGGVRESQALRALRRCPRPPTPTAPDPIEPRCLPSCAVGRHVAGQRTASRVCGDFPPPEWHEQIDQPLKDSAFGGRPDRLAVIEGPRRAKGVCLRLEHAEDVVESRDVGLGQE